MSGWHRVGRIDNGGQRWTVDDSRPARPSCSATDGSSCRPSASASSSGPVGHGPPGRPAPLHGRAPWPTRSPTSTSAATSRLTFARVGRRRPTVWPGGLVDHGVAPGDRVAICTSTATTSSRGSSATPAIHKAGAVAVPTNTRLTARELADGARPRRAGRRADLVVAGPTVQHGATGPTSVREVIEVDGAEWERWLAPTTTTPIQVDVGDDDLADIMYTSGTTGPAQGHRRPPPQQPHMIPQRRAAVVGRSVDPLLAAVHLRRHRRSSTTR